MNKIQKLERTLWLSEALSNKFQRICDITSDNELKAIMAELKEALSEIDYIIVRHVDENYTEEIQHYTEQQRIEINNIINQYFTL